MKKLFLIHGRGFKPSEKSLRELWLDALRWGIRRDFGENSAVLFDGLSKVFIYYGGLSNDFLRKRDGSYNEDEDLKERRKILKKLKSHKKENFNKTTYHSFSSPLRWFGEAAADMFARPASVLGIGDNIVGGLKPDLRHYWREDFRFGSDVRWKLTKPLRDAFRDKDDVMLVGHSLGTMIAYDVLWKFSHTGEYQEIRNQTLAHLVTLGSPLGDPIVMRQLKGGGVKNGARRYPTNVDVWSNIAAEDDLVCHDEALEDDFQDIGDTEITDYPIYNLSAEDGKARQHHSSGYLVHPKVAELVTKWMTDGNNAKSSAHK